MTNNEIRKENDQERIGIARLLSPKNVADILGISVKTVHKLVRERKLGCVQVTTKERRFTKEQVRAYIDAQSNEMRVDKGRVRSVSSHPKKGGDSTGYRKEEAKDSWASLREEMSRWM